VLGDFHIASDDSPRALFSPNPQLVREEQMVNNLTTSTEPGSFIIVKNPASQEVYQGIEQLEQQLPVTDRLIGAHNFFPSPENSARAFALNERLYGDDGVALEFMRAQGFTDDSIAQLQQKYREGKPEWFSPADFFARHTDQVPALWLEHDQQINTFLLIPKTTDLTLLKKTAAALEGVTYISVVEETTQALKHLRHSALLLLLMSFGLITVLMLLRFRSLRTALAILTVPFLALAGTIISFGALEVSLTLFHV